MTWVLVAIAGAAGAIVRWAVDRVLMGRVLPQATFPWGTLTINLSGSLALGLVTGLALGGLLPANLATVIDGGFIGAYTTFSTLAVESLALARRRQLTRSLANMLGTVVAGSLLAWIGLWVAEHPH
ncbi:Camphor resistance CrcB protein [Acidimicrobium ferrooxidans DSM 10331]|uniref:Fluoride-specific ion channel FluC n=1 Tax=Acidimicrobium ferrooxidans (strain DSM 10331 / JCM 15462 / NBRC 103882 / ICP) TaxID=525909 RepID=C7M329_ACIFD|nr:fluoride efflux transporter CrcB [Acidimicrobium ferrooxidans]ACU53423.1 Camphor resistance CrcB protein [Acidimicrobium ferrooxidans DSM 10331]